MEKERSVSADRFRVDRVDWGAVVVRSTSQRPREAERVDEFQSLEFSRKTIAVELGNSLSTVKQAMQFGCGELCVDSKDSVAERRW
jgi:hypothetical protein